MALPASGAISMSQVNTELGFPTSFQRSLDDTVVSALFGVISWAISMSNGWGNSAATTVVYN